MTRTFSSPKHHRRLRIAGALFVATFGTGAEAQPLVPRSDVDPALLLPPPPADNSATEQTELAVLRHLEATRTPAQLAHATSDAKTKGVSLFADVMGPGFDLARLPATAALFQIVRQEENAAAVNAKDYFRRNRPWIIDPNLHSCSRHDEPRSSYPSGHATMGFAMGVILARLAPSKAQAILARAADYAHSRLICEMHFPSDIVAGQAYGTVVADRLMGNAAFQRQFEAARTELQAAHLA